MVVDFLGIRIRVRVDEFSRQLTGVEEEFGGEAYLKRTAIWCI